MNHKTVTIQQTDLTMISTSTITGCVKVLSTLFVLRAADSSTTCLTTYRHLHEQAGKEAALKGGYDMDPPCSYTAGRGGGSGDAMKLCRIPAGGDI